MMFSNENWNRKQIKSNAYHSLPMSRPVSKNFNRISDFIFPDTIHIRVSKEKPYFKQEHTRENYSLPVIDKRYPDQRDLIVIEHSPIETFDNVNLMYREQICDLDKPVQRRYSSTIDERQMFNNEKLSNKLIKRSAPQRDRKKRHTTDNAYHSMLKSMCKQTEQQKQSYKYRKTLDILTDSDSTISSNQPKLRYSEPIKIKQEHYSSLSSDTSSDTDIVNIKSYFIPQNKYLRSTDYSIFDNDTYHRNFTQDSKQHILSFANDLDTSLFIDEDKWKNNEENQLTVANNYKSYSKINRKQIIDDDRLASPYFLIRPQTLLLLPNEIAKFKCCFGGDPFPHLIWTHNESHVPESSHLTNDTLISRYRTYKLNDIHYMDIGPVNLDDSGQIKCMIINKFGRAEAIVDLYVVPSPTDGMPLIIEELNDITVKEGQPLQLSCVVFGLQVTVNWFHNGKLISPENQIRSDYINESTIFNHSCCLRSDAGTVVCFVKNRFGDVRTSCRIEVINDPAFDR